MFSSVDESQKEDEKSTESEKPENAVSQTTPKESSQWYEGPRHVGQVIASPRAQWIEMEQSKHT